MAESEITIRVLVALSTCPDAASAQRIASTLVTERLAACVNQLPGVTSTYIWDGKLQQESEVLLIIKTTEAQLPELQARLAQLHPYELPELVALPVSTGSERYLEWVRSGAALRT